LSIPVLGSGDCIEPQQIIDRLRSGVSGVLVGRGVLRNPWILAQAADIAAGRAPREVTLRERGQFLLDYVDLLVHERVDETDGFRHIAPGTEQESEVRGQGSGLSQEARRARRDRWVVNKLRALCAWYSKGFERGSHLRIRVNAAASVQELRDIIEEFFSFRLAVP